MPGWECSRRFTKRFEKKVSSIYSGSELERLGRQTGFKKRKSKLSPAMFVDTVLFKELDNGTMSLTDHCMALKQHYGIDIQKQSLDERFDSTAVIFIRELLKYQLSNQLNAALRKEELSNLLQHFSSVKLKDSTRFQIPENLKEYYPGNTGASTGAGIHIQFEFDMLSGEVNDLNVTHALRADATDARQTMDAVQAGSLILRDLGYFSSHVLEHIDNQQAYYITRLKSKMNLYAVDTGRKLDFASLYSQMKRKKLSYQEIDVSMGDNHLSTRLIIEMLPEQQVQNRLAKAEREAKKKGSKLTEEYKSRARLNIFLTNIPPNWIPANLVRKIYRLRWQIELRFKAWKSFYHLEATKKMKPHRFECYLYASLLLIMINWEIAVNFFSILWRHTARPLSLLKFYKTSSQHISVLRVAILTGKEKLIQHLAFLYELSYKKLLTEKRNKHDAPLQEILMLQYKTP